VAEEAPAQTTEEPEAEAPEVKEDPTLAYKEWKKKAIARGKAVKAQRAAAEAPPQEAVKRYEVKKIAKDKAHLQDLLLKNYNTKNETDYDYQTFFQGVEKGDVPDDDDNVNRISFFEVQKRFGVVPPERFATKIYKRMSSRDAGLNSMFHLKPREDQGTEVYEGSFRDMQGKVHDYSYDRIVGEDPLQRRMRKGRSVLSAGTAEGVLAGIDLDNETKKAFTDRRSGNVSIPLFRTVGGEIGFDVYGARVKLQQHYSSQADIKARSKGQHLTAEAKEKIRQRSFKKAEDLVGRIMSKGIGVIFVDSDPEGTTEEIIDNPWYYGGGITAPARAIIAGAAAHDQAWNQHHKQLEGQSRLEYLANIALSTAVGAAIRAGGWGTPEHIRIIREGYDITDDFGNIARFLTPRFLEREQIRSGAPEVAIGVAAMIPLLLLDPDLTLLLGPAGKTVKGGAKFLKLGKLLGVGADANRLLASRKLLGPVLKMDPTDISERYVTEFMDNLARNDPDNFYVFEAMLKTQEFTKGLEGNSVSAGVERARKRVAKLDNQYAKATELSRRLKSREGVAEKAYRTERAAFDAKGAKMDLLREELAQAEGILMDMVPKVDAKFWDTLSEETASVGDKQKLLLYLRKRYAKLGGPASQKKTLEAAKAAPAKALAKHDALLERLVSEGKRYGGYEEPLAEIKKLVDDFPVGEFIRVMDDALEKAGGLKGKKKLFRAALPEKLKEFLTSSKMLQADANQYLLSRLKVFKAQRKATNAVSELAPLYMQVERAKDILKAMRALKMHSGKGGAVKAYTAAEEALLDAGTEAVMGESYLKKIDAARSEALQRGGADFKRVAKELSDSIKVMADNLQDVAKVDSTINPLVKSISKATRPATTATRGERFFNPDAFKSSLNQKYGEEVVTEFMDDALSGTSATDRSFVELMQRPSGHITMDEQVVLRSGLDKLDVKVANYIPEDAVVGHNLYLAAKSVVKGKRPSKRVFAEAEKLEPSDLPFWDPSKYPSAQSLGYDIRQLGRTLRKSVDPAYRKFGNSTSAMRGLFKQALEVAGATQQEYSLFIKGLRGAELKAQSLKYLQDTGSLALRGGNFKNTMLNTGPMSLVKQSFRHILGDPVTKNAVEGGAEWVDEAVAKGLGKGEDVSEIYRSPKALKAIARAWLPNARTISNKVAFQLEQKAAELISEMVKAGRIDFDALMTEMGRFTSRKVGVGTKLDNPDKAWHFATQGVLHGATMDKAAQMAARAWRPMPEGLADDFNNLISGNFEDVKDIKGLFKKFSEFGRPLLNRNQQDLEGLGTAVADLVKMSKTPGGEAIFAPTALYKEIDNLSGKIVKDLSAVVQRAPNTPIGAVGNALLTFFQMLRTSITTGLLIPNPRYWVNNIFGDFAQIWMEHGLSTAARLSFQNLPTNFPFGREIQNAILEISERLEGRPFLGSMLNALVNPQLNKVFNAPAGTIIRLGDGTAVKVDDLRRMMAEDGVLDTFVAETLLKGLREETANFDKALPLWAKVGVEPGGIKKALKTQQEMLAKHATFVQQRQRAALYLDLLSKGATRPQAKKGVLDALYDWKAPLTAAETKTVARAFTFWRFYRLATQQFLRSSFDALSGTSNTLRRVRQMQKMTEMAESATYHFEGAGEEWDALTAEEKYDAMLRDVPFWWQQARPTLYASRISSEGVKEWLKDHGYDFTYQKILLPPLTPLDMGNMWLGFAQLMLMTGGSLVGADVPADNFSKLVLDPVGAMLVPGLATGFEHSMKEFIGGSQYVGGGRAYLRAGESEGLQQLNFLGINRDEKGRAYVDGNDMMVLQFLRVLPLLGTQLPQYWAGAENPYWQESAPAGMLFMMTKLMGVAPRYQQPERDLSFAVRERKLSLEKALKAELDRVRQLEWKAYQKRKKQEKK